MKNILRPADRQHRTGLQRAVERLRQLLSAFKQLLSVPPSTATVALTPIRIPSQRHAGQPGQRRRHP